MAWAVHSGSLLLPPQISLHSVALVVGIGAEQGM